MSWGLQHFKRVQFHHVSSTQWHDRDDSHMTTRYHNVSVMSSAWVQSPSSWIVMNHAERWTMLSQSESSCADREYLRCSRTRDLGSGVIRAVQSPRWQPGGLGSTFSIHFFPEILWDSFARICWKVLERLGSDCFPTQCLCQRYISGTFSFFLIFVAHGCLYFSHTTMLFRWLAATFRFRGFLCFDALLLQAWFGIGVCEQNMDMDRNLWWTQYRNYSYIVYILYRFIWATVNIWYIAPSHQFLKSVLSFFRFWHISKYYRFLMSVLSFSKPQLNFQKIETARILLSINLNFGCSSYRL